MKKDDLIKIFVLVVVAAFVLGMFTFDGSGQYGEPPSDSTPTPTPQSGLFGSAEIDGVVAAYPDGVLIVNSADADGALGERLKELVRNGSVSYMNTAGEGSLNLILPAGADVSALALNLTLDFPHISTRARAQFTLPESITFRVAGGNLTASVSRRPVLMVEPLVPVGGSIPLVIGAIVEREGVVVSDIQVSVGELEGTAVINATVQELDEGWSAQASYLWEARPMDSSSIEAGLKAIYPDSVFSYHSNPFIVLNANATAEQASGLQNLSYVNLVVGKTVLIETDFVDRQRAQADFEAVLNSTEFSFPDSYAEFNSTSGEPDLGLVENAFPGSAQVLISRFGWVSLGTHVRIEGREYVLPGGASFIAILPANATAGDSLEMPFFVEITGARITSLRAGA